MTWGSLKWAFTADLVSDSPNTDYWQPVTILTRLVDVHLFGLAAPWHHRMNVVWHIINTGALFLVLGRLTRAWEESAWVAALFALHPMHVESVAWITERKDLVCGFFWIMTLLTYHRYTVVRSWGSYWAAILMFALCLGSKPMGVTLPVILLFLDYWPLRRHLSAAQNGTGRSLLLEKLPFVILALVSSIITLHIVRQSLVVKTVAATTWATLANYGILLLKTLLPTGLAGIHPAAPNPPIGSAILSLVTIGAISCVTWRWRLKAPWLVTGWVWFLVALVPISVMRDLAWAERLTYLPHIGLFCGGVWTLCRTRVSLGFVRTLLVCVCVAFGCLTWDQAHYWQDNVTFYRRTLEVADETWLIRNHIGGALLNEGRFADAEGHLQKAIAEEPNFAEAQFRLSLALAGQGKAVKAIQHLDAALCLDPSLILAGRMVEQLQDPPTARAELEQLGVTRFDLMPSALLARALTEKSEDAHICYQLGLNLGLQDQLLQGIACLRMAVRLRWTYPEAHAALGLFWSKLGEPERAEAAYRDALRLRPEDWRYEQALACLLASRGKNLEALTVFQHAFQIKPESPFLCGNIGVALALLGRTQEAVVYFEKAIQLQPGLAETHFNLGLALVRMGARTRGIEHLAEAVRLKPNWVAAREQLAGVKRQPPKLKNIE